MRRKEAARQGTETSHGGWVGPGPSEAGASPEEAAAVSWGRFNRKVVTGPAAREFRSDGSQGDSSFQDPLEREAETQEVD